MTVGELIELLKAHPHDMRVTVRGYEGGFNDVKILRKQGIVLDEETSSYYGQHSCADWVKLPPDEVALELWGRNELSMYKDTLP